MRKLVFLAGASLIVTPLVPGTAFAQAQQPQQQQQQSGKTAPDPNQVICEKQEELGSRIATKRVCMTRSQWAEQRRLDRQDVDKAQTQAPMSSPH
jgi:invasion protein IalB